MANERPQSFLGGYGYHHGLGSGLIGIKNMVVARGKRHICNNISLDFWSSVPQSRMSREPVVLYKYIFIVLVMSSDE